MTKIIFNMLGMLALGLAILGVFLPLLPTTPFLLLASACFVRGSETMHKWLLSNKLFGAYLSQYRDGQGLPLRAKAAALAFLWISLAISIWHIDHNGLRILLCFPGIAVSFFLLRMKTRSETRKANHDATRISSK